jgi:hypothetical protein
MQWGGNCCGYFLLHSSHSMDCVLCVRILVWSVIICVFFIWKPLPSNNPQVITLNLLLFDCTYCQSFWRFECFCHLKCMWWRKECVPRDSCKARGTTTTMIMTTKGPLQQQNTITKQKYMQQLLFLKHAWWIALCQSNTSLYSLPICNRSLFLVDVTILIQSSYL